MEDDQQQDAGLSRRRLLATGAALGGALAWPAAGLARTEVLSTGDVLGPTSPAMTATITKVDRLIADVKKSSLPAVVRKEVVAELQAVRRALTTTPSLLGLVCRILTDLVEVVRWAESQKFLSSSKASEIVARLGEIQAAVGCSATTPASARLRG